MCYTAAANSWPYYSAPHFLYLHPQTHRAHIIYTIESILLDTIALHIAQVNLLFVLLVPMHSIVSRYSLPSHPTQPAALRREEKGTLILFHIPWPEQHELSTFLFHSAPVSITPFVHSILCIDERPRAFNLTRTTQDEVLTLTIPSIVQKSNYSGDSPLNALNAFLVSANLMENIPFQRAYQSISAKWLHISHKTQPSIPQLLTSSRSTKLSVPCAQI